MTAFVSIIGVIYSLLLPNIYESKALLVPVDSSSSISGALGSYSSLAGLAGIRFLLSDEGNSSKAIKKLALLSFFENNILLIFIYQILWPLNLGIQNKYITYDESIYETIQYLG